MADGRRGFTGGSRPFGLRGKLLLLVLFILLPLVLVQSVQIYRRFDQRVEVEVQARYDMAEATGKAFTNYVRNLWSTELTLGLALTLKEASLSPSQQGVLLGELFGPEPALIGYGWLSADGRLLDSNIPGAFDSELGDREYVRRIQAGEEMVISDLLEGRFTGKPAFVVARGIRKDGRLVGIVTAVVDPSKLGTVMGVPSDTEMNFGLVDRNRMIVYRNTSLDLPWDRRHVPDEEDRPAIRALRGHSYANRKLAASVDGETLISAAVPLPEIGWAAYSSAPRNRVLAAAWADTTLDILAFLLITGCSVTAALMAGNAWIRPVAQLAEAAHGLAQGDWSVRVHPKGEDEIATAAQTFDHMVSRLAEMEEERSRALLQEQVARSAAEESQRRLAFLAEASGLLAASLDIDTTLNHLSRLVVNHLADWCAIDLFDAEGALRRAAVYDKDPARMARAYERFRRFPPSPEHPYGLWWVITQQESRLYSTVTEELVAAVAQDEEHLRMLRDAGIRSCMLVPLTVHGRTIGTITIVAGESGRSYFDSDLALAEELARRTAMALESARLYQETQQALRRTDEMRSLLDTVLAAAPMGMGFTDQDLNYIRVNESLAAMNGIPVENHIGRSVSELLPAFGERLDGYMRRVVETKEPLVNVEISGESPASPGEERHWMASYYPVLGGDGHVLGVGTLVSDITDRKRAEIALRHAHSELEQKVQERTLALMESNRALLAEVTERQQAESALRESERRFRAIFDRVFQFIGLMEPVGTVLEINQTALDFGGIDLDQVVNRPFWEASWWTLSPEIGEALRAAIQRAAEGEFIRYEVDVRGRDDLVATIDFSIKPIRDDEGNVALLIAEGRDITELKRAEAAERAREAAEERERARTRFLQIAAHELRNPMASVKGILALLRRRLELGRPLGDLTGMTGAMEREIDRLSTLLNEMLQAFQIQEGKLRLHREPVDLTRVLEAALGPFRAAEERHRFVLSGIDQGPVVVVGDFGRLEEVVRNLMSNAVKYSPGGDVQVSLAQTGDEALLSVSDSGMGIPRDQSERVFEGFFRASNLAGRDPGGLGLGLYICRELVQQHGGKIWVESDDGMGATFHVALPLLKPGAVQE